MTNQHRYLIIRLSSLGDIAQCLPVADLFKAQDPDCHVTWLVRSDFEQILSLAPAINTIESFRREQGFIGLILLAWKMSAEPFYFIYDAHNNVRSHVFMAAYRLFQILLQRPGFIFARRKKSRFKRFLLFKFHWHLLPKPFQGMRSFLEPLKWWFKVDTPPAPPVLNIDHEDYIALAPSAAWELKRWPKEYFKKLISLLPNEHFVLLGGPEDAFLDEIIGENRSRVENLAGKLTWDETTRAISKAKLVVSNDTGVLHIADWLARPALALIGPTAFGYPTRPTSQTLEIALHCKPCSKDGRGPCRNGIYKRCLFEISPELAAEKVRELLQ